GKPAIAYSNQSGNIKYVIAKDPLGAGWETPTLVDAASGGANTSLKIINTRPAISYSVYNYPNSPLNMFAPITHPALGHQHGVLRLL
ncbi:MAG: hypothetical protein LH478_16125, partial [Chitinophagaceae bacterium]|nr:hypothetical protein [Chitinophagaceae bacterium]